MKHTTKEKIELLNNNSIEVINYLRNNTIKQTLIKFNTTRKALSEFMKDHNVNSPGKGGNNKLYADCKTSDILTNINQLEVIEFYKNHSKNSTINEFNITGRILEIILANNNTEQHDKSENTLFTNREKYGCDNVFQNENIKEKCCEVKLDKYGNEHYVNPDKAKQTNLEKWGSTCTLHSKELEPKIQSIMVEKYGNKYYFQSDAGKQKCALNKQDSHYKNSDYTDEYKEIRLDRDKSINFLENNYLTRLELAERFNCTESSIQTWIRSYYLFDYIKPAPDPFHGHSDFENEVKLFIESIYGGEIVIGDRDLLNGKEIDIYLPDIKIGIECNGTYWHSDLFKPKNYHELKSKLAEELGIRLIHIYQYEWESYAEKLQSMLKIALGKFDTKIYARQCEIRLISNKEAKVFNDKNHLQNHRNAQITYGLFYKNELVQLMSFSKHKKYEWEIIRGCPASNNIVIGGVSKLFKHFINEQNPNMVFSYCDFNKFDGHGYESIGMKFIGYTGPDKKLFMKDNSVINRSPSNYKKLKPLVRAYIWGSGSKKYLWSKI